eukprot:TRINITY_DN1369_c0_g1_i1.p1 TRINITY_DN1369_c0_g1~~TRINITY_DN1369_c0_g1_i1.p1  ORF type:complete len:1592 (-),score=178.13 TRINITY_DN1369_c0_g1_i1:522-5297(-)
MIYYYYQKTKPNNPHKWYPQLLTTFFHRTSKNKGDRRKLRPLVPSLLRALFTCSIIWSRSISATALPQLLQSYWRLQSSSAPLTCFQNPQPTSRSTLCTTTCTTSMQCFYLQKQPAYLMSLSSYSMYTLISFIGFSVLFTLLFIVLLVSHWNTDTELRHSLAYSYILRISGLILVFIKYILFQPMVTVLMTTVRCSKISLTENVDSIGYECYSEVHILLMVSSALAILMLITLSVVSILFFSDEDPESRLPWAYCSRLLEAYKLIKKFLVSVAIYATQDNTGTGAAIIIFALFLSVLSIHLLYKQLHMKDKKILYILLTTEGMVGWFILLCLIYVVTGLDWTHPAAILLFVLVFFTCSVLANKEQCEKLISLQSISALKEAADVEIYCRILLEKLTDTRNYSESAIEGFIQIHAANCKVDHCPCKKRLKVELESKEEEEDKLQDVDNDADDCKKVKVSTTMYRGSMLGATLNDLAKPTFNYQGTSDEIEGDKIQQDFIKIVINDLTTWSEKQDGKARIHIYLGYLKATCLKNKLAALYEVMCAEESNPSLYERFLAYRLMRRIEDQIVKKESREHSTNEIDNLIQFQQILAEMQENMQEVLKLFIGFWKELQDESPNFQYLGNMSHDISQNAIKIRGQYRKLVTINPTNLYCRMLYALFLKKIMKDEFEAYDVYDETNRASNNLRIQNTHFGDDKYGANSRTALFIISGAKTNVGEVLCINNEVSELLGYEKAEIVGHNISKAMPPIIGEKHSEMVLKYLCSGKLDRSGEKMNLALHKLGYIVPCSYLHRVVPNLRRGLQLIGFMYKIHDFSEYCPIVERNISTDDVVIVLTDQNWMMQAFNIKAAKFFGIDPAQANLKKYIFGEEKIPTSKLIPQLEDPAFIQNVATSLSAEVTLDATAIRKTIDAEIEILKATQADEGENGTPRDELEKGLEVFADNSFKGPLTFLDLSYGKYETDKKPMLNMKLIVVVLEQLLEKEHIRKHAESSSNLVLNAKAKKKEDLFVDDVLSQSQSSHSSHSSTEHEQRTVRSFKETIKEQKSPFFARCFIKLGILIFLMILASASILFLLNHTIVMEYVLINMLINFIDQSLDNSMLVHRRFNYLLNIPNNFRTIFNIYQNLEANSSELFDDRVTKYTDIIAQESEYLRDLSHRIEKMRHPFSAEHKQILQSQWIRFVEKPDPSSVTNTSATMNYTLPVAITQYVAKATELKQYNLTKVKLGADNTDKAFGNALDRLASFMIDNAKGTLTYYADKTKELFFSEFNNEIESKTRVITIALIVDPIVIILLMILFIPFILKVQSNLLKIYLHLCQFKDSDIRKWLEICNNSSSDIKSSITRIRKIYGNTSFEVILNNNKEADNEPKANVKVKDTKAVHDEEQKQTSIVTTTQNQTETPLVKQSETGEEATDELIKSKEDVLSERKQKMFSQMTKEKTKAYLLYLLFFALYIGIFRTADGIVFSNLYDQTDTRLYLLRMISMREHNDIRSMFYLREELRLNQLIPFFESILLFSILIKLVNDAAGYYTDSAFESEMEYSKARAMLTGPLTPLREYLSRIDFDLVCEYVFTDKQNIDSILLKTTANMQNATKLIQD